MADRSITLRMSLAEARALARALSCGEALRTLGEHWELTHRLLDVIYPAVQTCRPGDESPTATCEDGT